LVFSLNADNARLRARLRMLEKAPGLHEASH
jgi:hypothetical protein